MKLFEFHQLIIETMHKRHNIFRRTRYKMKSLKWQQQTDEVRKEIEIQAYAVLNALEPYLDIES